ncbi:cell wall protein DAN4 [Eurytemora carolleeae]|uniref:cell wall protein DAN4 n=1 Tax=Eurytemora carolleeae TaxID=1294199 RepID=UPI000C787E3C|nr:cell wall protein DAN4 [Eurytemora carolleeae]|eukprot:XP_023349452.1 cell wall protein DAN4-like [Eurytemora affinis]
MDIRNFKVILLTFIFYNKVGCISKECYLPGFQVNGGINLGSKSGTSIEECDGYCSTFTLSFYFIWKSNGDCTCKRRYLFSSTNLAISSIHISGKYDCTPEEIENEIISLDCTSSSFCKTNDVQLDGDIIVEVGGVKNAEACQCFCNGYSECTNFFWEASESCFLKKSYFGEPTTAPGVYGVKDKCPNSLTTTKSTTTTTTTSTTTTSTTTTTTTSTITSTSTNTTTPTTSTTTSTSTTTTTTTTTSTTMTTTTSTTTTTTRTTSTTTTTTTSNTALSATSATTITSTTATELTTTSETTTTAAKTARPRRRCRFITLICPEKYA